jgi:hypothetical protein
MYNNLKKFHQARTQQLSNMFNGTQAQGQNRQGGNYFNQNPSQMRGNQNFGMNTQFNGMGNMGNMRNRGGSMGNQMGGSQQGFLGGNQAFNRNQNIINYLTRIRARVIQDLNEAGRAFKDQTNFKSTSDLCLLIEVYMKINNKNVGVLVKMNQTFPKTVPRLKLMETFIHSDINRSNNSIRIENICTWNTNKKIPDLIMEVENYFKISPPENSPELQDLISDIVKINKAITSLKNFNYASFQHNLLRDQQMALANGDYNCLRTSQEYEMVKQLMFQVSNKLKDLKMEVLQLQHEIRGLSEEKKEVIEKFQMKLEEFENVKMNVKDLSMKYDSENIKKFLQNETNKLMYKKEELKQKMLECDIDELGDYQEDYLKVTKNMSRYVTLMEKAFAY